MGFLAKKRGVYSWAQIIFSQEQRMRKHFAAFEIGSAIDEAHIDIYRSSTFLAPVQNYFYSFSSFSWFLKEEETEIASNNSVFTIVLTFMMNLF